MDWEEIHSFFCFTMSKTPDDPKELFNYLQNQINEYDEALKDDEEFCSKDIDATFEYLKNIEQKFQKKIHEYRIKLEQLRIQNRQVSQRNRDEFVTQKQMIRQFYDNQKYSQGLILNPINLNLFTFCL